MAGVIILGDTSGSVTLSAPAVAGTVTVTLPSTTGTMAVLPTATGVLAESAGGTGTTTGYYGFKNRIINGAMVIDQRNAGASVTNINGAAFSVDRWNTLGTVVSKFTAQQNAGSVTPPDGFVNYLGATSLSAYTVSSGDYFYLRQTIEGNNIADLGWGTANAKTVTLSFWVRSSLTGTFGGGLNNSAFNRSYPFSFTINSANTWEQKTISIAGDTSGTWVTNNGLGISLSFGLGVGSTASGTANAWAAGNFSSVTGATSVVGTNGATFYITGVQLEKGSTATSFDYRPYSAELQLCQRYCRVYGNYTSLCTALAYQTISTSGTMMFGQTMRATPTVTPSGVTLFQTTTGGGTPLTSTNFGVISTTPDSTEIQITVASGLTVGQAAVNRSTTGTLTISAEL